MWVRFPSLYFKFWSRSILSKAASVIGTPLYIDKATASAERTAYARVFVEISANKFLPKSVNLHLDDGELA